MYLQYSISNNKVHSITGNPAKLEICLFNGKLIIENFKLLTLRSMY